MPHLAGKDDCYMHSAVALFVKTSLKIIPAKFQDFSVMLTNLKDSHDLTIAF